jgi:hypothetical protein
MGAGTNLRYPGSLRAKHALATAYGAEDSLPSATRAMSYHVRQQAPGGDQGRALEEMTTFNAPVSAARANVS